MSDSTTTTTSVYLVYTGFIQYLEMVQNYLDSHQPYFIIKLADYEPALLPVQDGLISEVAKTQIALAQQALRENRHITLLVDQAGFINSLRIEHGRQAS
jgi:hypothetical protein